ncbi:glycosyltransferase family 2 protein [Gloeobacter violaceus]|nr:glycosyltransferase [Gloeobacter violaceus]
MDDKKSVFCNALVVEEVRMTESLVTIVVVPRERFSAARQSLDSIYEHTEQPFALVYVDGGSPPDVRLYLEEQAKNRSFELVQFEEYLPPNRARNAGLARVQSKYVVFMDNDVIVAPGWLNALVECAEKTGAAVVSPLTCIGQPLHRIIHCAGGEAHIATTGSQGSAQRRAHEKIYLANRTVDEVRSRLRREPTELAEFHCVLVRTDIFERIGQLDEAMLNTREHIDFSMMVSQSGGTVYFEPDSVVTYLPGPPLQWQDIHFYMLRWSDAWEWSSLQHFRQKWNLTEDEFFKNRYKRLGWRRRMTLIRPWARKFSLLGKPFSIVIEQVLLRLDRPLNWWLTRRYAARSQG